MMKELFTGVSMVRRSHFLIFNFLQGKVLCFGTHFQGARLLGPCLLCVVKKFIWLCLLHEDGIVEACRFYLTKKSGKFLI